MVGGRRGEGSEKGVRKKLKENWWGRGKEGWWRSREGVGNWVKKVV